MSDHIHIPVHPQAAENALLTPSQLQAMTRRAHRDPDGFWLDQAERIHWHSPPTQGFSGSLQDDVSIGWYRDGTLNASVSCIDSHLWDRADQVALISHREGTDEAEKLTYRMLHERVCRLANALQHLGVSRGDRVAISLPMVSEAPIAMLACARIGAVHVVLFGGLSAEAIAERLNDSGARVVITANEICRGTKRVPLKQIMDEALDKAGTDCAVDSVLVLRTTDAPFAMLPGRDIDFHDFVDWFEPDCTPEIMNAEDPLFLLYTSGSTGKPKAVVHSTGGYMVWAAYTMGMVYTHRPNDVLWCTADVAWITGHTSVVYGPLANGGTTMIFDGLPSYPQPGRWWDLIEQHKVTMLFTAPTAIRSLMREGDDLVNRHDLSSLRLLGTAGEPISPDAWMWYHDVVGKGRCPVVDTWWQTETAGIMLGPIPGAQNLKPGSATMPLPGVSMVLTDTQGNVIDGAGEGCLCVARSWPGQARTLWKDHARFQQTYFTFSPGLYFTGDGARRDADGYYWITGRMDDVINISGHRIGTAEVEEAVGTDKRIAECAAVGVPHPVKGQALVVFAIPRTSQHSITPEEITRQVSLAIGRYAAPDEVFIVPDLPRTRSGKIVRRLLRKIASGEIDTLGDLSMLSDADSVGMLINTVWKKEEKELNVA